MKNQERITKNGAVAGNPPQYSNMAKPGTIKVPTDEVDTSVRPEDMYEVILYNDDHNEAGYVVGCIVRIFKHSGQLARKIMFEAHRTGRAIAEVEGKEEATLHKQQLESSGLTAEIQKV